MGLAYGNACRGSAAFFAMLLSASSGQAGNVPFVETGRLDLESPGMAYATSGRLHLGAASKFTRRRLLLARRLADASQRL